MEPVSIILTVTICFIGIVASFRYKRTTKYHSGIHREERVKPINWTEDMKKRESDLTTRQMRFSNDEKLLQVRKDAHEERVKAWINLEEIRRETSEEQIKLKVEIAKLEARKQVMEEFSGNTKEVEMLREEVKTLKNLLTEAMKAPKIVK